MNVSTPTFRRKYNAPATPSYFVSSWKGHKGGANSVDSANRTHFVIESDLPFDRDHLQTALAILAEEFNVLTLSVEERGGEPWLVPAKEPRMPLYFIDIDAPPNAEQNCQAQAWAESIVWKKFQPGHPLSRAFAVKVSRTAFWFGLVISHFICDDVSLNILRSRFQHLYEAVLGNKPYSPRQDAIGYCDYLWAMREWFDTADYQNNLVTWCRKLEGYISPPAFTELELSQIEWVRVPVEIGIRPLQALRGSASANATSLFVILLAANLLMLRRLVERDDALISNISLGRDQPILCRTVGRLVDRTLYRLNISDTSISALVRQIRKAQQEAAQAPYVPAALLLKKLEEKGQTITSPVFNFRPWTASTPQTASFWRKISLPKPKVTSRLGTSVFQHWIELTEKENSITGFIRCAQRDAARSVAAFQQVIEAMTGGNFSTTQKSGLVII
jgi:hypothetical protein